MTPNEKLLKLVLGLKTTNVFFFPGSFNPWHQGHEECLKQFYTHYKNQKIILIHDKNPFKFSANQSTSKNNKDTLKNVILKYQQDIEIKLFEDFQLLKSNPTINWVRYLKENCPHNLNIGLVMGADSFVQITQWTESNHLIQLLSSLIVIPRALQIKNLYAQKESLNNINNNLQIDILERHPYEHISSTNIRKGSLS